MKFCGSKIAGARGHPIHCRGFFFFLNTIYCQNNIQYILINSADPRYVEPTTFAALQKVFFFFRFEEIGPLELWQFTAALKPVHIFYCSSAKYAEFGKTANREPSVNEDFCLLHSRATGTTHRGTTSGNKLEGHLDPPPPPPSKDLELMCYSSGLWQRGLLWIYIQSVFFCCIGSWSMLVFFVRRFFTPITAVSPLSALK